MAGNGVIVHLSDKGFGFISSSQYENNLFFHAKDLKHVKFEDLKKGDEVSFLDTEESDKGIACKGINLL